MIRNYIVTNYRFDDTFKAALHEALSHQTQLNLECDNAIALASHETIIRFIPHQISNMNHIFDCIGLADHRIGRLEEINGTLHLSVS